MPIIPCFLLNKKINQQDLMGLFFSIIFGIICSLFIFILPDAISSSYGYAIQNNNSIFYIKFVSCIIGLFSIQYYFYVLYAKHLFYCKINIIKKLVNTLFFAIGYFFVGLFWLNDAMYIYGGFPLVASLLACLLFSIYNSLFFVFFVLISPKFIFIPFAFVLCEWLRGTLFTGFPWLNLGYALIDTPFSFFAQYVGVYGLEFLALFIFSLLILFLKKLNILYIRFAISLVIVFCMCFANYIYTLNIPNYESEIKNKISIRVIQGAISQDKKFSKSQILDDISMHLNLMLGDNYNSSNPSKKFIPDLIITPETVFPVVIDDLPDDVYARMLDYSQKNSTSILFGAAGSLNSQYTNSLFFISNNNKDAIKTYHKYHLVPFGEFIPYGFKWFVNNLIMPMGDFASGDLVQDSFIFNKNGKLIRFSANICYELLFGEELAEVNKKNNPDFFVNSTNLGWFGNAGLVQFLNIARMRALELKKTIIVSNNSGISAVILPNGIVKKWLDIDKKGVLDLDIGIGTHNQDSTFYTKHGNLPILIFSIISFIFLVYYNIIVNRSHKNNL
jgi:apolipoprotein N-acyltransferase